MDYDRNTTYNIEEVLRGKSLAAVRGAAGQPYCLREKRRPKRTEGNEGLHGRRKCRSEEKRRERNIKRINKRTIRRRPTRRINANKGQGPGTQ